MKKTMTMLFALALVITTAAQHGRVIAGSRLLIVSPGIGWGLGYSPYYYSPFGYPYGYPYGYANRPSSKLDAAITDLKNDYKDKIKSARQDKSLDKEKRNKIVDQLKASRDQAIHDLKANYYKPKKTMSSSDEKG